VPIINANLSTGPNTASSHRLKENAALCFMGTTKVGHFDLDAEIAQRMMAAPRATRTADPTPTWSVLGSTP